MIPRGLMALIKGCSADRGLIAIAESLQLGLRDSQDRNLWLLSRGID